MNREPDERVILPMLRQRWESVTFLHWRYDASALQRLIPRGIRVEEIDGSAWVSITPLVCLGTRLGWLPAAPGLADFPETNVRTYVETPAGGALWFFTLEADSLPLVSAARGLLGLPYQWSAMAAQHTADRCTYRSRRRSGAPVGHRIEVRPGRLIPEDELGRRDVLLADRWRAAVPRGGRCAVVPVTHEPWSLHHAELLDLDLDLWEAVGLSPPAGPPEVRWSPGVDATLGLPRWR